MFECAYIYRWPLECSIILLEDQSQNDGLEVVVVWNSMSQAPVVASAKEKEKISIQKQNASSLFRHHETDLFQRFSQH